MNIYSTPPPHQPMGMFSLGDFLYLFFFFFAGGERVCGLLLNGIFFWGGGSCLGHS